MPGEAQSVAEMLRATPGAFPSDSSTVMDRKTADIDSRHYSHSLEAGYFSPSRNYQTWKAKQERDRSGSSLRKGSAEDDLQSTTSSTSYPSTPALSLASTSDSYDSTSEADSSPPRGGIDLTRSTTPTQYMDIDMDIASPVVLFEPSPPQLPPKRFAKRSLLSPLRHVNHVASLFGRNKRANNPSARGMKSATTPTTSPLASGAATPDAAQDYPTRMSWHLLEEIRRESLDYDACDTECAIMSDEEDEDEVEDEDEADEEDDENEDDAEEDEGDGVFEVLADGKSAWGELWQGITSLTGMVHR